MLACLGNIRENKLQWCADSVEAKEELNSCFSEEWEVIAYFRCSTLN